MTIKEFAKNHGITVQAVYARIKADGINLQDIKRENSPELTAEGLDALNAMFDSKTGENNRFTAGLKGQLKDVKEALEIQSKELESIKEEAEALRHELDEQRRQTEHWKALADMAQQQADRWSEALKDAQIALRQQQALQMAAFNKALPAAGETSAGKGRKLSLWERITGRAAQPITAADPAAGADPAGDPRETAADPGAGN